MAKVGRPSKYTKAIANEICKRIADGEMLLNIVQKKGMPDRRTVYDWLDRHEEFAHIYARACKLGAHALVEQGIIILDKSNPISANMDRNRADYRKWLASKRNPESYGDRQAIEMTGKDGGPMETISINEAMAKEALSKLDAIRKERAEEENKDGREVS